MNNTGHIARDFEEQLRFYFSAKNTLHGVNHENRFSLIGKVTKDVIIFEELSEIGMSDQS